MSFASLFMLIILKNEPDKNSWMNEHWFDQCICYRQASFG